MDNIQIKSKETMIMSKINFGNNIPLYIVLIISFLKNLFSK
jgi:hypothetical protein